MVAVVSGLALVEVAQRIADGSGGIRGEFAFGWIEGFCGAGEGFLGGHLDFRMGQSGDVGELAGDFRGEGDQSINMRFHVRMQHDGRHGLGQGNLARRKSAESSNVGGPLSAV